MAKEVNKRVNVFINGKEVENNIKSIRAAMAHLTNQLNKMTIGSKEYNDTSEKLKALKKIYDDHVKSLKSTREEVENLSHAQRDNVLVAGAASSALQGVHSALQKFVSSTQEYVEAYATIDDAMSGVMKTTGMTREEGFVSYNFHYVKNMILIFLISIQVEGMLQYIKNTTYMILR